MINRYLYIGLAVAFVLGLVWMYGDARYVAGRAAAVAAQLAVNEAQLRADAKIVPILERKDDERSKRIGKVVAQAVKELPAAACFNTLLTADDERLLSAVGRDP